MTATTPQATANHRLAAISSPSVFIDVIAKGCRPHRHRTGMRNQENTHCKKLQLRKRNDRACESRRKKSGHWGPLLSDLLRQGGKCAVANLFYRTDAGDAAVFRRAWQARLGPVVVVIEQDLGL